MHRIRGTSRQVLERVADDPSFTWDDRWAITEAIDYLCGHVDTADLETGPPRIGVARLIFVIPDTDPPIAITFELYKPSLYREDVAGIYLHDISRVD